MDLPADRPSREAGACLMVSWCERPLREGWLGVTRCNGRALRDGVTVTPVRLPVPDGLCSGEQKGTGQVCAEMSDVGRCEHIAKFHFRRGVRVKMKNSTIAEIPAVLSLWGHGFLGDKKQYPLQF